MAPDHHHHHHPWFSFLKSAMATISNPDWNNKKDNNNLKILAFEVSTLMSKLISLSRSLSDSNLSHLRYSISSPGVRKVVSDDDSFLLALIFAELTDSLRLISISISHLSSRCSNPSLRSFPYAFKTFVSSGEDSHHWVMSSKDMLSKSKKMDRLISSTSELHSQLHDLADSEELLKKLIHCSYEFSMNRITTIAEAQQRVLRQRQQVEHLKQVSLWGCTCDAAVKLLARYCFTVFARILHAFGAGHAAPQRSLSAAVYPAPPGPLISKTTGLFEWSSRMLAAPETTIGAAALAARYANVVIIVEKMMRAPGSVGQEGRDDLYGMLPDGVRGLVRRRLRGVVGPASDAELAIEWREAISSIMAWLGPLAHDTVTWQTERFTPDRRRSHLAGDVGPMMWRTLWFANREKVEAAVTELLVGLNYIWRFELELSSRKRLRE
ncbi:hypothetical protein DsansV1_C29g0209631 [Dioscorea sansibarensis]